MRQHIGSLHITIHTKGDILIHPAVWPQQTWEKIGWRGLCPFSGGAGSPSNTKLPGPRPTSIPSHMLIHPAIWPQQISAENWGLCPFGRGARSPSNTMWPGPRPTCMPSFILIHPTVWLQHTKMLHLLGSSFLSGFRPWTQVGDFCPPDTLCLFCFATLATAL